MTAPLDGVKIVDFTRVLAGPHCTKQLRDLGASVVKIETMATRWPRSRTTRTTTPTSTPASRA